LEKVPGNLPGQGEDQSTNRHPFDQVGAAAQNWRGLGLPLSRPGSDPHRGIPVMDQISPESSGAPGMPPSRLPHSLADQIGTSRPGLMSTGSKNLCGTNFSTPPRFRLFLGNIDTFRLLVVWWKRIKLPTKCGEYGGTHGTGEKGVEQILRGQPGV